MLAQLEGQGWCLPRTSLSTAVLSSGKKLPSLERERMPFIRIAPVTGSPGAQQWELHHAECVSGSLGPVQVHL